MQNAFRFNFELNLIEIIFILCFYDPEKKKESKA